jgi:hypothetical protein
MVCSECGEPLSAKDVRVHPGPGQQQPAAIRTPAARTKAGARTA